MTEKQFQTQVVAYAALTRWAVYHTHDSRRSAAGFPDLVLVRGERLVFAELKTDTGVVSSSQADWYVLLKQTAAEVYLWRPCDWKVIERTLAPGAQA